MDVEGLVAFAADDDCVHVVVAGGVVQHDGCAFGAGEPTVSPGCHRRQDRVGVASFVGEAVLVADRVLLILDATQEPLFDEPGEAQCEDVAPDPEFVLEIVESSRPEACLADQQQVPVVAEHGGTTAIGHGHSEVSTRFTSAVYATGCMMEC